MAAESFAVGVAAGIVGGSTLGWLLHRILAADCRGDGWCELGAAVYGVGLGVLVGCLVYVVAGVVTIRRHRREGDRLAPSLVHAALPIGLVILSRLASFGLSSI